MRVSATTRRSGFVPPADQCPDRRPHRAGTR
jgi:hypothetical protein